MLPPLQSTSVLSDFKQVDMPGEAPGGVDGGNHTGVSATYSPRLPQWIPLPASASVHSVDNEAQTTEEMVGREQCEKMFDMFGTKMSGLVCTLQEMTQRLANLEGRGDTTGSASRSAEREEASEPRLVDEALRGAVAVEVPDSAGRVPLIMSSLQDLKDEHNARRAALKARRREERQERLNSTVARDTPVWERLNSMVARDTPT